MTLLCLGRGRKECRSPQTAFLSDGDACGADGQPVKPTLIAAAQAAFFTFLLTSAQGCPRPFSSKAAASFPRPAFLTKKSRPRAESQKGAPAFCAHPIQPCGLPAGTWRRSSHEKNMDKILSSRRNPFTMAVSYLWQVVRHGVADAKSDVLFLKPGGAK